MWRDVRGWICGGKRDRSGTGANQHLSTVLIVDLRTTSGPAYPSPVHFHTHLGSQYGSTISRDHIRKYSMLTSESNGEIQRRKHARKRRRSKAACLLASVLECAPFPSPLLFSSCFFFAHYVAPRALTPAQSTQRHNVNNFRRRRAPLSPFSIPSRQLESRRHHAN